MKQYQAQTSAGEFISQIDDQAIPLIESSEESGGYLRKNKMIS